MTPAPETNTKEVNGDLEGGKQYPITDLGNGRSHKFSQEHNTYKFVSINTDVRPME